MMKEIVPWIRYVTIHSVKAQSRPGNRVTNPTLPCFHVGLNYFDVGLDHTLDHTYLWKAASAQEQLMPYFAHVNILWHYTSCMSCRTGKGMMEKCQQLNSDDDKVIGAVVGRQICN